MATIWEGSKVFIRNGNERAVEAVVLSRQEDMMRVAVKGGDDVLVLRCIAGTWVSEDLDPVEISFVRERHLPKAPLSESDCICPKELAAHLIHLLRNGGDENESVPGVPCAGLQETLPLHVI